jgi:hypothetical protein
LEKISFFQERVARFSPQKYDWGVCVCGDGEGEVARHSSVIQEQSLLYFWARRRQKATQFSENEILCCKYPVFEKKIRLKRTKRQKTVFLGCRHIYVYWLDFLRVP